MYKQSVLFKLKFYAEGASREENIKKVRDGLDHLVSSIPELKRCEHGVNIKDGATNYDIAALLEFEDKRAFKIFYDHPEHKKISSFIKSVIETKVSVDYRT